MRHICRLTLIVALCASLSSGCRKKNPKNPKLDEFGKESVRLANTQADLWESLSGATEKNEIWKLKIRLQEIAAERNEHNKMAQQMPEADQKYLLKFDPDIQKAQERIQKASDRTGAHAVPPAPAVKNQKDP